MHWRRSRRKILQLSGFFGWKKLLVINAYLVYILVFLTYTKSTFHAVGGDEKKKSF